MAYHPFFDEKANDVRTAITVLNQIADCQPWPTHGDLAIMEAANTAFAFPGIESIFLRQKNGQIEILLDRRSPNDNHWPNAYHIPGTTPRVPDFKNKSSDDILLTMLHRIWSRELKLTDEQMATIKVTHAGVVFWQHARGCCVSILNICRADEVDFPVGEWHSVDALPQPFLGNQEILVETAIRYAKKHIIELFVA